jgi:hypothetical protein
MMARERSHPSENERKEDGKTLRKGLVDRLKRVLWLRGKAEAPSREERTDLSAEKDDAKQPTHSPPLPPKSSYPHVYGIVVLPSALLPLPPSTGKRLWLKRGFFPSD